jgi:hypothetical protein
MHCYFDNEQAIGICKVCGKGICKTHVIEVNYGLVCSEECKTVSNSLYEIRNQSKTALSKTSSTYYRIATIQLLVSVLFLIIGISAHSTKQDNFVFDMLFFGFGAIMLLSSIFSFISGIKLNKK